MSDTSAVWPDGAREALWQLSGDRFEFDDVAILTALEPFVQQRIAEATKTLGLQLHEAETRNGITGGVYAELYALRADVMRLSTELREYQQVLRDHNNTATPDVMRGLLDQFKSCRAERDRLRAEVARLREDGELLDWMDRHRPNAMGGSRVSLFRPVTDMIQERAIGGGTTYRAAIRAARSGSAGGEG